MAGADIVYAAAGGTGLGVMKAAENALEVDEVRFAIGVDSNQDHLAKGAVLTSMIKRVDVAVESQINAIVDGFWTASFTSLGVKEEGVGITDMKYTRSIAVAPCSGTYNLLDVVDQIASEIVTGTIVVEEEIQSPSDYNKVAHLCSEPLDLSNYNGYVPTTTIDPNDLLDGSNTTTHNSNDSSSTESYSLPISFIPFFTGLFIITIIRRREN